MRKLAIDLLLFLLLLSPAVSFALDTEAIIGALEAIRDDACAHDQVSTPECKLLNKKLALLSDPSNKEHLDRISANYNPTFCQGAATRVAQSWLGAAQSFHEYEPFSILQAILCIENNLPRWQAECKKKADPHYSATWNKPSQQCSVARRPDPAVTVPDQSTHEYLAYQEKFFPKLEITLSNSCEQTEVYLFQGKGSFKIAHKLYEYRSWKNLKHRVLLKYQPLPGDLNFSEKFNAEETILRELTLNARLQHHNWVGIPGVEVKIGKTPQESSLLVEAFDDELGQLGKPLDPFSKGGWQQVASQITAGLSFLHSMGYLHQDIKPENVLVSDRNHPNRPPRAAIADFGLNKNLREECENSPNYARTRRIPKGTPWSRAPEQFDSETFRKWVGNNCEEIIAHAQKTEVFSFAGVLYRLKYRKELPWLLNENTGATPKDVDELAVLIRTEAPKLIEKLKLSHDPMDQLLAQAFSLNVAERPSTRELQIQLDALIKKQIQKTLIEKLPTLRTDLNSENIGEALGKTQGNYIAYIETSPTSGIFELKMAHRGPKNQLTVSTLEANPFDELEVAEKTKTFEKQTGMKIFHGERVTHPDTGPRMQDIPPPVSIPIFTGPQQEPNPKEPQSPPTENKKTKQKIYEYEQPN